VGKTWREGDLARYAKLRHCIQADSLCRSTLDLLYQTPAAQTPERLYPCASP